MTEDKALALIIDLLKSKATITTVVGSNGVRFAQEELPTETPIIYIGDPTGNKDQEFSDLVACRVEVFETARDLSWTLAGLVDGELNVRANTSGLDSTVKARHPDLQLFSIFKIGSVGQTYPKKDGVKLYSVILDYELRGIEI